MGKSVIVYGPQGCGKTRLAKRIAAHFGLAKVVEADDAILHRKKFDKSGTLYLTCMTKTEIDQVFPDFRRVVAFTDLPASVRA